MNDTPDVKQKYNIILRPDIKVVSAFIRKGYNIEEQ